MVTSKQSILIAVLIAFGLIFCVIPAPAQAQVADDNCPAIVETVLDSVAQACTDSGRNKACYGNSALTAIPRDEITDFTFDAPGDLTELANINTIELENMDVEAGTWGVVLLKVQANLPDTLPGQNVTFLLFGDVSISNAVDEDDSEQRPMQAIYFSTGIGDRKCNEAPDSGILVQTPEGVGTINMTINGVDVELGSTAFLQSSEDYLDIYLLEHEAFVDIAGVTQYIPAGALISIPLGEDGLPTGEPGIITAYDGTILGSLPLSLLPRVIEVAAPLTAEEIAALADELPGFIYTVQPGDTLFSIARCFRTTHAILAADNNLTDPNIIYSGQQIFIASENGTIPPQPTTWSCARTVQPTATETSVIDDSVCDLNWCYEGEEWGDGRCNTEYPVLTDWYWNTGWHWACYEAGYLSQPPSAPMPAKEIPFSASFWGCQTIGMAQIDYSGLTAAGETLTFDIPGCGGAGSVTTSGAAGSFTLSTCMSPNIAGPGWIKNTSGYTVNLPSITCP